MSKFGGCGFGLNTVSGCIGHCIGTISDHLESWGFWIGHLDRVILKVGDLDRTCLQSWGFGIEPISNSGYEYV